MLSSAQSFVQMTLILITAHCSTGAFAQQKKSNTEDELSGGFLKLGVGLGTSTSPFWDEDNGVVINLTGRYQWKNGLFGELPGLFSNSDANLNNGPTIGWNFGNTERWSFDIIAPLFYIDVDYEEPNRQGSQLEIQRGNQIRLGFRSTGSFDDYFLQMAATTFPFQDKELRGLVASLWGGKKWQVKNWNFFSTLGVEYTEQKILDYYFGISPSEATALTPAYQADSGINVTAQFGVSYPISKKWVFESSVNYTNFSEAITDSPIIVNTRSDERTKHQLLTNFTINYVF